MKGIWLIISVILTFIGLAAIGYFYGSFKDDCPPKAMCEALLVIFISIFWPFVICVAIGILTIMIPILFGVSIKKVITINSKQKLKNRDIFENELKKS